MTKQEADFIGSMNMCDEISNEAYKKIMCNCEVEEEECEDCISRQYLIERATGWDKHFADSERYVSLTDIQNASSVTPQPKRGKWISHREHCENLGVMASGLGAYEWCSNCDCGIDVKEFHRNYYNFCPNCGADMREVQDGD